MTRSLRVRLFVGHLAALAGVLALTAVLVAREERGWLIARGGEQLARDATLAAAGLPLVGDWPAVADQLGRQLVLRVTLIAPDGTVIGDSEVARERLPALENHATRPEVRAALAGQPGHSVRLSASVGVEFLYTAVPVRGVPGLAVLRLAEPLVEVRREDASLLRLLAVASALAFLTTAVFTFWLLGRTTRRIEELERHAQRLGAGGDPGRARELPADEVGRLGGALNRMAGEQRARLAAIARDRDQRELVLEHMSDGVALLDADGRVMHANRGFAAALDLTLPPAAGTHVDDVRVPELSDLVQAARAADASIERVLRLWAPHERLVRATATPIAGGPMLLVLRDQSEPERLDRVRRDFVANVSHELKTPLTSVRGYAETLLEGGLEDLEHREEFVRVIRDQATRLEALVDDLLSLAELERPEARLRIERFDLRALVERQRAGFADRAAHSGLELALAAGGPEWLEADRARLEQVVANLLENAIKYTERGRVVVTLGGDAGHVWCEVADTGPGIPEADRSRIFERFYRVDKARSRDQGGTGLGLSIVKHIVALHDGQVGVESTLGDGSRFRVELPRRARARP